MKRLISLIILSLAFVQIWAEVRDISYSQLPEKARTIVQTGFADREVKSVKIEKRASLVQYEVKISGGYKVQFSKTGVLTEVECSKSNPVPARILPKKILAYMATNHPDNGVMKYEHDNKLYVLVLDNLTELTFNGSFRLIDVEKPE